MANYNDYLEYLKHIDNTTEQEIKTKIDGLNDEISNLKTSLSNLNKVKDDLTTDLANAKKQINEKVDLINLKETELKKVTSDLANVQKDLKDTNFKLTELEKMHNIEQKKNATISNELAEVKSKYYILESEVKNKNKTVNDYITEIQKLHLELENAKNDFKNASASNTSTTEQINKYRSEINNLNKTIDDLRKKNNSAELTDLKVKLDRTESELNELAKNKNLLDKELKTEKERNKNLNDTLVKKNEELKNFEPKNKLKYILGGLAVVFLITTLYFYSEYQSSERQAENYYSELSDKSSELEEKVSTLNDVKENLKSSGKYLIIKDIEFVVNSGNKYNSFSKNDLKRVQLIFTVKSLLDESKDITFKFDEKLPNGGWEKFNGSYYETKTFSVSPGVNKLEFSNWGWEEAGNWQSGTHNFTIYCDNAFKSLSKNFTVEENVSK